MLCMGSIQARDIYVYNGAGITPVSNLQNVKKIAFSATGMNVTTESGTDKLFALTEFNYFTFYQRTVSGIGDISQNGSTGITFDGTNVNISSPKTIDKVTIYNSLGAIVESFEPKAKTASQNILSLAAGVYMVKVLAGNETYNQKIIK